MVPADGGAHPLTAGMAATFSVRLSLIYSFMALRAVYRASWPITVLKGAVVTVAYTASLTLVMLVLVSWTIIR